LESTPAPAAFERVFSICAEGLLLLQSGHTRRSSETELGDATACGLVGCSLRGDA